MSKTIMIGTKDVIVPDPFIVQEFGKWRLVAAPSAETYAPDNFKREWVPKTIYSLTAERVEDHDAMGSPIYEDQEVNDDFLRVLFDYLMPETKRPACEVVQ